VTGRDDQAPNPGRGRGAAERANRDRAPVAEGRRVLRTVADRAGAMRADGGTTVAAKLGGLERLEGLAIGVRRGDLALDVPARRVKPVRRRQRDGKRKPGHAGPSFSSS